MASVVVTADTAGKSAFAVPNNKIGKIKLIEVDNQSSSAITVTIQDRFTPSPTANNPSPTEVTVDKKVITVAAGSSYTEKVDGYIDIIGECIVIASATDAACKITIAYDTE